MRFSGFRACLPVVAAIALTTSGCGKVKDALKDAAGVDEVDSAGIAEMKAAAGWDDVKMAKFKIEKGFELTDKFPGDLGKSVEIGPIPLDVPKQAEGAAGSKSISYSLLKLREFTVGENKFSKFEIVSVARYDFDTKMLKIDGEAIGTYLDDADRIKKDNKNQEGKYLIVRGEGTGGLAYLTGKVTLKKADATEPVVGNALVYTTESPFVARSGTKTGQFLLAVLEQAEGACKQGGFVSASKPDVAPGTGTPGSTQAELPCIGVLDTYKDKVNEKAKAAGQESKGTELFNKANTIVTDFLGGWKMGTANLVFVQPPPPPATPPAPPPAPEAPPPPPAGTTVPPEPVTPAADTVDVPPPASVPITRGEVADPQFNLGCAFSGNDATTGIANTLVADPAVFDDYTTKGWRFFGDVRITNDLSNIIFGDAATRNAANARSIDTEDGYCLLTTGNQLATLNPTATFYGPKDGKVSEMWQKVKVPANATAIQIRVGFFSQEYPSFVGTQFNDAFYAMFDESPYFIAQGNLNDLAGINDAANAEAVTNCGAKTSLTLGESHKCGEWENITAAGTMHGALWSVAHSSEGPALASKFNCGEPGAEGTGYCYPGMIAPRVICRELDADLEVGKTLTLRIGVTDVGDSFYDSALAVDSVVFSTEANPCDQPMFSGDAESEVTRNPRAP